jgi:hypothetical protein
MPFERRMVGRQKCGLRHFQAVSKEIQNAICRKDSLMKMHFASSEVSTGQLANASTSSNGNREAARYLQENPQ